MKIYNDTIATLIDGDNDVETDDQDVCYNSMYLEMVFNKTQLW